jgi:hypothetical protein
MGSFIRSSGLNWQTVQIQVAHFFAAIRHIRPAMAFET